MSKRRVSQVRLAAATGKSRSQVSRWLKGEVPDAVVMWVVGAELGCALGYLVGALDDPAPPVYQVTEKGRKMLALFMSLTEAQQDICYESILEAQEAFKKESKPSRCS